GRGAGPCSGRRRTALRPLHHPAPRQEELRPDQLAVSPASGNSGGDAGSGSRWICISRLAIPKFTVAVSETGRWASGLPLSSSWAISRMRHICAVELRTAFSLRAPLTVVAVLASDSTPP